MLVLKGTLYSQFIRQQESKCYRESDLPNQKISTSLIWKADYLKRIQSVIGLASSPNENV